MSNINFLKPDRTNLNTFLYLGSFLFFISILDVFLNSFFRLNLTGFLPNFLSFLSIFYSIYQLAYLSTCLFSCFKFSMYSLNLFSGSMLSIDLNWLCITFLIYKG